MTQMYDVIIVLNKFFLIIDMLFTGCEVRTGKYCVEVSDNTKTDYHR